MIWLIFLYASQPKPPQDLARLLMQALLNPGGTGPLRSSDEECGATRSCRVRHSQQYNAINGDRRCASPPRRQ